MKERLNINILKWTRVLSHFRNPSATERHRKCPPAIVVACLIGMLLFPIFAIAADPANDGKGEALPTKDIEWALKTNLLYDATLSPTLAVEVKTAPKWSFQLMASYNPWTLNGGKKWKHLLLQPEARYWFCEATGGHFVAAHLLGGIYNIGQWGHGFKFLNNDMRPLANNRYQGWFAGAGIAYGYSWVLTKHWNIEAEIGLGWAYTRYDVYECEGCGRKTESKRVHNYVGPTEAAVNLVYVF